MKSLSQSILVLTDGRAGNVAMAEGLADAVAMRTGGTVQRRDVTLPPLLLRTPARVWSWLPPGAILGRIPALPPAGLVIGAGRRIAPVVEALGRADGVRSVQILGSGVPHARFDRVVMPAHDGARGDNVIEILGSVNRITPEALSTARAEWEPVFAPLAAPRIAVLIGGATKRKPLDAGRFDAFVADLARLAETTGGTLVVTASRRTGEAHMARLRSALPRAWVWGGTGRNPYTGMLAWADAVIVTDDSINMASEAASTPAPVAIYPLLEEVGKTARFHAQLFERGGAEAFAGHLPVRHGPPLSETARVADEIAAMLG